MVSSVHAIYRIAPMRKTEERPTWFSQRACLRSFIAAADAARRSGLQLRSTVVVDGELGTHMVAELAWFDEQDHISLLGNSAAFRHALEVALHGEEDLVLFAEDDYMWTSGSIVSTIAVLDDVKRASYASPYSHPVVEDESQREMERHRPAVETVDGITWRSAPRTTMTFACRRSLLRNDRHCWWLASYGNAPKDGYAFSALLEGRWFMLVGNAAFRDPRRVTNLKTARLVAECLVRRIRPNLRPVLMQPLESLATHVHETFITGQTNWRERSESFVSGCTEVTGELDDASDAS